MTAAHKFDVTTGMNSTTPPTRPAYWITSPGSFFNDWDSTTQAAAQQSHLGRRGFVGETYGFDGNSDTGVNPTGSWLQTWGNGSLDYFEDMATFVSSSSIGGIAGTFAAKQSTASQGQNMTLAIGSAHIGAAAGAGVMAWSIYAEAERSNANAGAVGVEFDTINTVANGGVSINPYMAFSGTAKVAYGLALASGGNRGAAGESVHSADQALEIRNNGATWRAGVLVRASALASWTPDASAPAIQHVAMSPLSAGWSFFNADNSIKAQLYGAPAGHLVLHRKIDVENATLLGFNATSGSSPSSPGWVGAINYNTTTGQVVYGSVSDARLKDGIEEAEEAGALIDAIRIRRYRMKTGGETSHGLIAQELHAVFPDAVSVGDTGTPEDEAPPLPWAVDPAKLVPLLIREVQSLRARVARLERG